jgi:hypothetical protein
MPSSFNFSKRYRNRFLFLYLIVNILPCSLYAEDDKTSLKNIARLMNEFRNNNVYSLRIRSTGPIANTTVFIKDAGRMTLPIKICEIQINHEIIKKNQLTENAIAVIIGHEMGHCEYENASGAFSYLAFKEKNWSKEYSADQFGVNLASLAGFDGFSGFKELSSVLENHESTTHPSIELRIQAIQSGNRLIKTSLKRD